MMEFWCGLASLKEIKLKATVTRDSDQALLNGPALEDDEGIASQTTSTLCSVS
jgi:chemotaxis protein CheZ